jgi:hypothetical protein
MSLSPDGHHRRLQRRREERKQSLTRICALGHEMPDAEDEQDQWYFDQHCQFNGCGYPSAEDMEMMNKAGQC